MYERSATVCCLNIQKSENEDGAVISTAPFTVPHPKKEKERSRPRTGGAPRLDQRSKHLPEPHLVAQCDGVALLAIVENFHEGTHSRADTRERRGVNRVGINAIAN